MLIGVIADDFTGASDIANTLANGTPNQGGIRTAQFAGVPSTTAPKGFDAGVVSLKSRTAPKEEAVGESLRALEWLQAQGCKQFVFKYCSTFDSTKNGNIGPVAKALADALEARKVVFCPAFPRTRRTVYQGHLFVGNRLLHESGMENHPLTPMTDSNLGRWLGYQINEDIGLLNASVVAAGSSAIRKALDASSARFFIADSISDDNLLALGTALSDAILITGGSGIALGLPRNLLDSGSVNACIPNKPIITGPSAIMAGSCSGATRNQINVHAKSNPTLKIEVSRVMEGSFNSDTLIEFYERNHGKISLAYSSGIPTDIRDLQTKFGREEISKILDALFAETAEKLIGLGYRRLVVAGGETSGAVAQAVCRALGVSAMTIGPEIDAGIPMLTLGSEQPVALALKSGNFGEPEFFTKSIKVMASAE